MPATKELSPVVKRGQLALREPKASLASVAAAMLQEAPDVEQAVAPFPAVPKALELTPEVKDALAQVGEVFAAVQPTERRMLTETEVAAVYLERQVVKTVSTALKDREETIKEYVRNHFDVAAEVRGDANPESTPRDANGHYVIASLGNPETLHVEGTNEEFRRSSRTSKAGVNGSALLDLYEAGEITRDDYLAFTREVRVFDEEKALKAINADPARLEILARLAVPGATTTAISVAKSKG